MANEEQSKDRRSYSVPEIQVHGVISEVTLNAGMASKIRDAQGEGNVKTS